MNTFRPFRWHDWPLFQRLARDGISLDVETSLTRGTGTFRNTLLASLPADVGGLPTYVVRHDREAGVGQLRHQIGESRARIAFAAPRPERGDSALWESLMEAMTIAAGQRGATNLIAEVDEDSAAFEGLRRVGFAVYARQEIWRRAPLPLVDGASSGVRPCRPQDGFNAMLLYANVVPGLLRQVEPQPALGGASFVLADGTELVGFFTSQRGTLGSLLEAYLHPAAEHRADEAIAGVLYHVQADRQVVHFRVRSHQNWLGQRLDRHGFQLLGQQAMMVKHTVARVEQPAFQLLPAIEGGVKASTPTPMVDGLVPPLGKPGQAAQRVHETTPRLC